jgi:hypothetical protein
MGHFRSIQQFLPAGSTSTGSGSDRIAVRQQKDAMRRSTTMLLLCDREPLRVWRAQFVPRWRAIQNKTTTSYTIEITCDFFYPQWFDDRRHRPRTLPQGISARLTTACAFRPGIVVLSSGDVEALRPRFRVRTRSRSRQWRLKRCTPESS